MTHIYSFFSTLHFHVQVEILEKIPGFMAGTPFSFAFFSSLSSGAKIAPHFGPCNIRLRIHLPLVVPEGDCGMMIGNYLHRSNINSMERSHYFAYLGGDTIKWECGEPLIFDDCYEHSGIPLLTYANY